MSGLEFQLMGFQYQIRQKQSGTYLSLSLQFKVVNLFSRYRVHFPTGNAFRNVRLNVSSIRVNNILACTLKRTVPQTTSDHLLRPGHREDSNALLSWTLDRTHVGTRMFALPDGISPCSREGFQRSLRDGVSGAPLHLVSLSVKPALTIPSPLS